MIENDTEVIQNNTEITVGRRLLRNLVPPYES